MKKRWVLFVALLILGFAGYFLYSKYKHKKPPCVVKHAKYVYPSYFVEMDISCFTPAQLPCFSIAIGDLSIPVVLDLGFRGNIVLPGEVIYQIGEKDFVGEKWMYGFRGTKYNRKIYSIPKVEIGDLVVSRIHIQEETDESYVASSILKEGVAPDCEKLGRVGWELFKNGNLFLDLGRSKMVCCDSLQSLQQHGYLMERFTTVPLVLENGFIECVVTTPNGPLSCVLDTGASWNFVDAEMPPGQSIEQFVWDPQNAFQTPLQMGDQDFGLVTFHRLPIHLPVKVDAILGMEFFKTNQVFIDFAEKQLYFAPCPKAPCSHLP